MPRGYASKRKGLARVYILDETYPKLIVPSEEVDYSLPNYVSEMPSHPIQRRRRPQQTIDRLTGLILSDKLPGIGSPDDILNFNKTTSLSDSLSKIAKRMQVGQNIVQSRHFKRCLALQYLSALKQKQPSATAGGQVVNDEVNWIQMLEQKTGIKLNQPASSDIATGVTEEEFEDSISEKNSSVVTTEEVLSSTCRINTGLRTGLHPYATITVHSDTEEDPVPIKIMLPQVYIGRFSSVDENPSEIDISSYSKTPKLISRQHFQVVSEASGLRLTPLGLNSIEVSVGDQETRWISANTPPLLVTQRAVITIADVTMPVSNMNGSSTPSPWGVSIQVVDIWEYDLTALVSSACFKDMSECIVVVSAPHYKEEITLIGAECTKSLQFKFPNIGRVTIRACACFSIPGQDKEWSPWSQRIVELMNPLQVSQGRVHSDAISVLWESQGSDKQHYSKISHYSVVVVKKHRTLGEVVFNRDLESQKSDLNKLTINGLQPECHYWVKVRPKRQSTSKESETDQWGVYSADVQCTTLHPVVVESTEVSHDYIQIKWQRGIFLHKPSKSGGKSVVAGLVSQPSNDFLQENNIIQQFQISVFPVGITQLSSSTKTPIYSYSAASSEATHIIHNLQPDSFYLIQTITTNTVGMPGSPVRYLFKTAKPLTLLKILKLTSTTVDIAWIPQTAGSSDFEAEFNSQLQKCLSQQTGQRQQLIDRRIYDYVLADVKVIPKYYQARVVRNMREQQVCSTAPDADHISLSALTPNTVYSIQLRQFAVGGYATNWSPAIQIQTLDEVRPLLIRRTSTTIEVGWRRSQPDPIQITDETLKQNYPVILDPVLPADDCKQLLIGIINKEEEELLVPHQAGLSSEGDLQWGHLGAVGKATADDITLNIGEIRSYDKPLGSTTFKELLPDTEYRISLNELTEGAWRGRKSVFVSTLAEDVVILPEHDVLKIPNHPNDANSDVPSSKPVTIQPHKVNTNPVSLLISIAEIGEQHVVIDWSENISFYPSLATGDAHEYKLRLTSYSGSDNSQSTYKTFYIRCKGARTKIEGLLGMRQHSAMLSMYCELRGKWSPYSKPLNFEPSRQLDLMVVSLRDDCCVLKWWRAASDNIMPLNPSFPVKYNIHITNINQQSSSVVTKQSPTSNYCVTALELNSIYLAYVVPIYQKNAVGTASHAVYFSYQQVKFDITSVGENCIRLSWSNIVEKTKHNFLSKYIVKVDESPKESDFSHADMRIFIEIVPTEEYGCNLSQIVHGLKQNNCYRVQLFLMQQLPPCQRPELGPLSALSQSDSQHDVNRSLVPLNKSKTVVTQPVLEISCTAIGDSYVTLQWKKTPRRNVCVSEGKLVTYEVKVVETHARCTTVSEVTPNNTMTTSLAVIKTVKSLLPKTSYQISVRRKLYNGHWGVSSNVIDIRTHGVLTPHFISISEDHLRLSWSLDIGKGSIITSSQKNINFQVRADPTRRTPHETATKTVQTDFSAVSLNQLTLGRKNLNKASSLIKEYHLTDEQQQSTEGVILTGLLPMTKYRVTVRTEQSNGKWGLWSKPMTCITLPAFSVTTTSVGTDYVLLRWGRSIPNEKDQTSTDMCIVSHTETEISIRKSSVARLRNHTTKSTEIDPEEKEEQKPVELPEKTEPDAVPQEQPIKEDSPVGQLEGDCEIIKEGSIGGSSHSEENESKEVVKEIEEAKRRPEINHLRKGGKAKSFRHSECSMSKSPMKKNFPRTLTHLSHSLLSLKSISPVARGKVSPRWKKSVGYKLDDGKPTKSLKTGKVTQQSEPSTQSKQKKLSAVEVGESKIKTNDIAMTAEPEKTNELSITATSIEVSLTNVDEDEKQNILPSAATKQIPTIKSNDVMSLTEVDISEKVNSVPTTPRTIKLPVDDKNRSILISELRDNTTYIFRTRLHYHFNAVGSWSIPLQVKTIPSCNAAVKAVGDDWVQISLHSAVPNRAFQLRVCKITTSIEEPLLISTEDNDLRVSKLHFNTSYNIYVRSIDIHNVPSPWSTKPLSFQTHATAEIVICHVTVSFISYVCPVTPSAVCWEIIVYETESGKQIQQHLHQASSNPESNLKGRLVNLSEDTSYSIVARVLRDSTWGAWSPKIFVRTLCCISHTVARVGHDYVELNWSNADESNAESYIRRGKWHSTRSQPLIAPQPQQRMAALIEYYEIIAEPVSEVTNTKKIHFQLSNSSTEPEAVQQNISFDTTAVRDFNGTTSSMSDANATDASYKTPFSSPNDEVLTQTAIATFPKLQTVVTTVLQGKTTGLIPNLVSDSNYIVKIRAKYHHYGYGSFSSGKLTKTLQPISVIPEVVGGDNARFKCISSDPERLTRTFYVRLNGGDLTSKVLVFNENMQEAVLELLTLQLNTMYDITIREKHFGGWNPLHTFYTRPKAPSVGELVEWKGQTISFTIGLQVPLGDMVFGEDVPEDYVFSVEMRGAGSSWRQVQQIKGTGKIRLSVEHHITTYHFRARVANQKANTSSVYGTQFLWSEFGAAVNFKEPQRPNCVAALRVQFLKTTTATIVWDKPLNHAIQYDIHYQVFTAESSDGDCKWVPRGKSLTNSFNMTGLLGNTCYRVCVQADSAFGRSVKSSILTFTTIIDTSNSKHFTLRDRRRRPKNTNSSIQRAVEGKNTTSRKAQKKAVEGLPADESGIRLPDVDLIDALHATQ